MDRLIVKNFGPLKDVDIELNKINLFIGENGSGKSVLAKIITILTNYNIKSEEDFFQQIGHFKINYISDETFIQFYLGSKKSFELNKKKIFIKPKIETKLENLVETESKLKSLLFEMNIQDKEEANKIIKNIDIVKNILEKEKLKAKLNALTSQYIPAERNFVAIISQSLSSFIVADIPLPKFFIAFSSEFEKAGNELRELEFLNVKYVNGEGLDRHKIYFDDKHYLPLSKSSSGIQSALPLYLTVKYFSQRHKDIIIEEPEQNLFPKAQAETVQYIIEQISEDNNLFMMTHSPYILTALNNLILANDVKEEKGLEAIMGIVKEEQCVKFEEVSAYTIVDGKSIDIMDRESRLIGVNLIDSISNEINDTFDSLLSKLD